ncbi:MAG: hypothetical protein U0441_25565 [Polyangiaceae bacterium]
MSPSALLGSLRGAWTRWKLRRSAQIGRGAEARGHIWIHGPGSVRIGARAHLDGRWAPIELHAAEGAEIVIAEDARIDGGVSIDAHRSVRVGARSHVGRLCKILDNHFHRPKSLDDKPQSQAVVIEEDVDLGVRSILLPGAHVGAGAVVGPATVVARRVPAGARIAGLPATVRRM